MKKGLKLPQMFRSREHTRRGEQILQQIQKTLLPEHASEIVAINVETGEYVLAHSGHEASVAFHKRWPDQISYMIRVDGGPVYKFHGK